MRKFPSLLCLLLAGCVSPTPLAPASDATQLRAEAARARFRALQEAQQPQPLPDFGTLRLERGPHTEDGVIRTGAETTLRLPRTP